MPVTIPTKTSNNVEFTHPDYDSNFFIWEKIRDSVDGQEAIKARSTTYLPMLSGHYEGALQQDPDPALSGGTRIGQKPTLYGTYLQYANWYAATGRTVEGLLGLIFRKPIVKTVPDALNPLLEDINLNGQSLDDFVKEVTREILMVYRTGVLIDFPTINSDTLARIGLLSEGYTEAIEAAQTNGDVEAIVDLEDQYISASNSITKSQKEQANLRPYLKLYKTECITNWREAVINNKSQTSFVVLRQTNTITNPDDEFQQIEATQYKVLDFDENGAYRQRVYIPAPGAKKNSPTNFNKTPKQREIGASTTDSSKGDWVLLYEYTPLMDGKPLDFIPFYPITPLGVTWNIDYPLIDGLANTNIAHYRNSANYENGLIWTGNPTPWVSGFEGEDTEIKLGSTEALLLGEGGKAGYMEFTGQGLSEQRVAMAEKEKLMAIQGARILAADKRMVEAADTALIHRAGEQSILASLADSVSKAFTSVLNVVADWADVSTEEDSIAVKLNKDYMPKKISANDMEALLRSKLSGNISWKTYFYNLQQGEIYPDGWTPEDELEAIEESDDGIGDDLNKTVTTEENIDVKINDK